MLKIRFKGKAAHGSKPELGDNAILKASDFIQELKILTKKLKKKKDPLLGSGTINVGKIVGGLKVNMVPDYCEVEIDRRLIPGETPSIAVKQIKNVLKKLRLRAKIEYLNEPRLAMKISKNSKIVKMIQNIIKTRTLGESGYTESELYYRECGIEIVSFGPGDPKLAHVNNEYIKISKIKKAVRVFETLIKKWCL
jgi:acetylornithine deacetylase/succinyl-diaminopimelate desuccinylase-like protein